jgi:hypothetical protein
VSTAGEQQAAQGVTTSPFQKRREASLMTVAGEILPGHALHRCSRHILTTPFRLSKAGEFEGKGGPEDKIQMDSARRPGDDDTMNLQEMKQKGIDRTA